MVEKTIIEDAHDDVTPRKSDSEKPEPAQTIFEEAIEGDDDPASDKGAPAPFGTIVEDATHTSITHQQHDDHGSMPVPAQQKNRNTVESPALLSDQGEAQMHVQDSIIGKVIQNKFRILRKIGDGGMGVVYEAEHLDLKKRFAIKSIRSDFTENPKFKSRFDQEAKTQALLQHPNIIQVTDFINVDGQYFLVMEYVEGQGLDRLLAEKKIDGDEILSILMDVLKGLAHAHEKGIIHRDIKPSNIMITEDGSAKLMDFGIALLAEEGSVGHRAVAGTPAYMSPEQINRPEAIDVRSDIYSLGIVMFEALIGKRPFDGDTDHQTQMNHIHKALPHIEAVFPHIAPELARMLEKSLKKCQTERFTDCHEFYAGIDAYMRQTHLECRSCKYVNRVKNKYALKGEKCEKCGKTLSMKSKFTKIWAAAFAITGSIILAYLVYPWPGKLIVKTKPEDAIIVIDGEERGRSPIEISLSPGEYQVEIKKEKFELFFSPVQIKKNQETALDIKLQKPDEMPRIAFENIKQSYQEASYICRDLNDLTASEENLKIAKSIGDSALTEAYQNQIAELEKNIKDGFEKYVHCFNELRAIKSEIRDQAYERYIKTLTDKGGDLSNLTIVRKHFEHYIQQGRSDSEWKYDIAKFC